MRPFEPRYARYIGRRFYVIKRVKSRKACHLSKPAEVSGGIYKPALPIYPKLSSITGVTATFNSHCCIRALTCSVNCSIVVITSYDGGGGGGRRRRRSIEVRSFVRSFVPDVRSFVRSKVSLQSFASFASFVRSFASFVRSFVCSKSFVRSCVCAKDRSFVESFVEPFVESFV